MCTKQQLLAVTLLSITTTISAQHQLEFVNQCSYTVWPAGATGDSTSNIPANGGFELPSGQSQTVTLSDNWNGRWWPRTDCTFDSNGAGKCLTGDCGGNIGCSGYGATPTTLAEFNINGNQAFYDISMVDGYNAPLTIIPVGGSGSCTSPIVAQDINAECPSELQILNPAGTEVIACMSGCTAFGTPQLCCTGQYNSQSACQPSSYSEFFKGISPTSYSYAWDSGTYFCNTPNWQIVFCPDGSGGVATASGSVVGGAMNVAANNAAATAATTTPTDAATTAATQTNAAAAQTVVSTPAATEAAATVATPQTAYRANVNLYTNSDSSCSGTAADSLSGVIADGVTCIQTNSLQYITVSCTDSTAELKAYDTSDCSGASGLIMDTPLSQCQSNGDGSITNGDATAHIITCGVGSAPAIPAQTAAVAATTPAATSAAATSAAATQQVQTQSGTTTVPVLPAALGHASVSSWTTGTTCSGTAADALPNLVADGTSCYPTNALGYINVICNNGVATLNSFSNNACSGSPALTQQLNTDTCETTSSFGATSVAVHCGTATDDVSSLSQTVYSQKTAIATTTAPATTSAPVSTGVVAPTEFLLTGLVFQPTVVANQDGTRSILFVVNQTATTSAVYQSLSYVIAHYQIDQSYQQNVYESADKAINGTFWFNLTQVPVQSLWYTFTIGNQQGVQLDTALNSLNSTVLAQLANTTSYNATLPTSIAPSLLAK